MASTSASPTGRKAKRKQDDSPSYPRKKQQDASVGSTSASQTCEVDDKLKVVKKCMKNVKKKLEKTTNDKATFMREFIENLKTDKKELVGVFGKTGAGKSSLINAIIGEKDLLPTGKIEACTSVIIKVEANTKNRKYIGQVEFISEEDFNNEMEILRSYFGAGNMEECDPDYESKLTALFGDEWKKKSLENIKNKNKRYKLIIKTLKKKTLKFSYSASEKNKLCDHLKKYTKNESGNDESKDNEHEDDESEDTESENGESEDDESEDDHTKKNIWYWPVVKNVTIKVPNNELLRHVTLVDLPGNGDCNKTRNEMWKEMLSSCGTVWVVAEANRAASEQEAWEILESACKYMGHGGVCRSIHFICTQLDRILEPEDNVDEIKEKLKKLVRQKLLHNNEFKRHFSVDNVPVLTVRAKEYFTKEGLLTAEETEIPELQELIKNLNTQQKDHYVSTAYGILSLMMDTPTLNVEQAKQVHQIMSKNVYEDLQNIMETINRWYNDFDQSLTQGVSNAKDQCEKRMRETIIDNKHNSSYHRTLKSVVEKSGVHKPINGKEINLNTVLSSFLTDRIDNLFRTVFPNDQTRNSFYAIIQGFSVKTKGCLQMNRQVKLRFLEEKIKELMQEILNRKKSIYNCLTETVQIEMQPCYDVAKEFKGKDSLQRRRETIMQYVRETKVTMFDDAKAMMLEKLKELMDYTDTELKELMVKVIKVILSSAELPDVSDEFSTVEEIYNQLNPSRE